MSTRGEGPSTRVGDAERDSAIEALNEHWRAGRLDPAEHERRTTKAHSAVTRADLDELFADLPGRSLARVADQAPVETTRGGGLFPAGSWVGQHRDTLMALAPFVALVGFFTLGREWMWFLLIPVLGVVLYAGDGGRDGRHRKRRRGTVQHRGDRHRGDRPDAR